MVMDSGPYPMGRMRVFAWESPEGQVSCGTYDWSANWSADKTRRTIPPGFVGVESLQMRGAMVRFRRWRRNPGGGKEDDAVPEMLVDLRRVPFTDVGFLEQWKPGADEAWRSFLDFDEAGDVTWIDWDAALSDADKAAELSGIARKTSFAPISDELKKHAYWFRANFNDRATSLAWRHSKRAQTLWDSIVYDRDSD